MSSITGGGVGGNVGGTYSPTPRDTETTAAALNAKLGMGILPDSTAQVIPLTELVPRYIYGYVHGQGYKATPGRALLDHPLDTVRAAQPSLTTADSSWQTTYNELVSTLPPDLLSQFTTEKNKPFDQRNASFTATDNILTTTAKALTQLQTVAQPISNNPSDEADRAMNLMLPFSALLGSISQGAEVSQTSQSFLKDVGANHPNFDAVSGLSGQLQSALTLLQQVSRGAGQSFNNGIPGQLDDNSRSISSRAAQMLTTLNEQMKNVDFGPDMQLLQPFANASAITATALALPNTASGALYLSLSTAMIGIDSGKGNEAGLVGPNLALFVNSLSQGIISETMPRSQQAGNSLLALGTKASLVSLALLSSLAANGALGPLPNGSPQDIANTQQFAFDTALQVAVDSGVLQNFYESLIAASGGNDQSMKLGGSALTQLAHLLIVLSGSNGDNQRSANLLEQIASNLAKGVTTADVLSSESTKENAAASVAIKQAAVALDHQDYASLLAVMNGWMEGLGSSLSGLQQDLKSMNTSVQSVIAAVKAHSGSDPVTGTINVV